MATYPILSSGSQGDATAAREWVGLAVYRLTGRRGLKARGSIHDGREAVGI